MTSQVITLNRRAVLALGAAAAAVSLVARAKENTMSTSDQFWPNNARLAVSFSLMFEAGGQPISGAPGSFGPIEKGALEYDDRHGSAVVPAKSSTTTVIANETRSTGSWQ
jgi:hypothetical protein